jgi:hypothetical protein
VATVQLPVTSHGSSVSIALTRASSGSKAFGGPVSIGAPDATSTGAHPTRVDLRYDDSIVPDHPGALHVYRLGKNSARIGVPRCLSSGAVPKGHSACVVRARCLGASAGNDTTTCGGVDVGVNTYQPFSRWIAT